MNAELLVSAGVASFLMVALRAFQQLNVMHDRRRWVLPTSLGMATCEAVIVVNYARAGIDPALILCTGVAAGLGCITAMLIHGRLRHE